MAVSIQDVLGSNWIYLKTFALHHIFYIIVILILLFAGHSWLMEHDARLLADKQAAISEQQVKKLGIDIAAVQAQAAKIRTVIIREQAAIKTQQQAVPVIRSFDPAIITDRPVPHLPDGVIAVESVALAKDIDSCRIDRVDLGACQTTSSKQAEIIAAKDSEIAALREKPGFWAQIKGQSKVAIIGYLVIEGLRLGLTGRP